MLNDKTLCPDFDHKILPIRYTANQYNDLSIHYFFILLDIDIFIATNKHRKYITVQAFEQYYPLPLSTVTPAYFTYSLLARHRRLTLNVRHISVNQ